MSPEFLEIIPSGELIETILAIIAGLLIGFVIGEACGKARANWRWGSATETLKHRGLFINRRASR